nr:hypothetical protein CFP56_56851 [Quercus suber]
MCSRTSLLVLFHLSLMQHVKKLYWPFHSKYIAVVEQHPCKTIHKTLPVKASLYLVTCFSGFFSAFMV